MGELDLLDMWDVDADGVVSVGNPVALSVFANGMVTGHPQARQVFVGACLGAFFRVLGALGCDVFGDEDCDEAALLLTEAVCELVQAVLPTERELAPLDIGAVASGLACVGDVVWGAAVAVAVSGDVEGEALRIAEGARSLAASGGGVF